MKRPLWLAIAAALCLLNTGLAPLYAGKLDLNIYSNTPQASQTQGAPYRLDQTLIPGDPRHLRGESRWVSRVTHIGFAALGIAGLAGSAATGGVGQAIGFGIVSLIHGIGLLSARAEK